MKIVYILLILGELLFGQTYKEFAKSYGFYTNYEKAFAKAKKEKKKLLLITVANFCPWCKKLENRVLKDMVVQEKIQNKFIPVIINKDIDFLEERFITNIVPMSYIVDYKTGKILKSKTGYQKKSDFIYFMNDLKNK